MAEVISSSEQPSNMTPQAVTNQNPQPIVSVDEAQKKAPPSLPDEFKHKKELHEFAQRSSLQLPVYRTVNEGEGHVPLFRSSVLVDGYWYTSPITFPQRKVAEHYAAKLALDALKEKMKHEGCPLIREDTIFCKAILNIYASKMKLAMPTYRTVQYQGVIPSFTSTSLFNGFEYPGERGRNRKEAEQLAARAAVKSILANDSGTTMLEIIRSNRKLYAALDKVQDTGYAAGHVPIGDAGELSRSIQVDNKRKAYVISSAGQNAMTSLGQPSDAQASNQFHLFQRPNAGSSLVEVGRPIEFVPPVSNPSLLTSTLGTKTSRRNKKKAKKNVLGDSQASGAMSPLAQVPPCTVSQGVS